MITEPEFHVGIAVFVTNPDEFATADGVIVSTASGTSRTYDPHYFICILRRGGVAFLVPCSSSPREDRLGIRSSEKRGHPYWKRNDTYVLLSQVWRTTVKCAVKHCGGDLSTPSMRNAIVGPATGTIVTRVRPFIHQELEAGVAA